MSVFSDSFVDKKVLVLGLDSSGRNVVRHLAPLTPHLVTFDEFHQDANLQMRDQVRAEAFDVVIAAPFLSPSDRLLQECLEKGVPVINELEVAYLLRVNSLKTGQEIPWIGITGTNGKSSTVILVSLILREVGYNVKTVFDNANNSRDLADDLADLNIGQTNSILDAASDSAADFVVLEVSANQMHFSNSVSFDTSAILNIAADHFDWFQNESAYIKDKAKIYTNTKTACVFNALDRQVDRLVQEADVMEGARAIGFTNHLPARSQVGIVEGMLVDRAFYSDSADPLRYLNATELVDLNQFENLFSLNYTKVAGVGAQTEIPAYILKNIAAATAITRSYGVDSGAIESALKHYRQPKSRNQLVYKRKLKLEDGFSEGEILYIDDTASQNPKATLTVAENYLDASVVLIAGGWTKNLQYDSFVSNIDKKLAAVILIGDESSPLYQAFRSDAPNIPIYIIETQPVQDVVKNAIAKANEIALSGQVVLFSPACDLRSILSRTDIVADFTNTLEDHAQKTLEFARQVGFDR